MLRGFWEMNAAENFYGHALQLAHGLVRLHFTVLREVEGAVGHFRSSTARPEVN